MILTIGLAILFAAHVVATTLRIEILSAEIEELRTTQRIIAGSAEIQKRAILTLQGKR